MPRAASGTKVSLLILLCNEPSSHTIGCTDLEESMTDTTNNSTDTVNARGEAVEVRNR